MSDTQHPWQLSCTDCPDCGKRMHEQVCVDKSCSVCLGVLDGYRCSVCGWSGDAEDLAELTGGNDG